MEREVRGSFKREGTYIYLWLIHVDVWQKPTKFCKEIILQIKKKYFLIAIFGKTLKSQKIKSSVQKSFTDDSNFLHIKLKQHKILS